MSSLLAFRKVTIKAHQTVVRPFRVHFGIAPFEVGRALLPVADLTGKSARPTIVKAQTKHDRARLPFGASRSRRGQIPIYSCRWSLA